MRIVERQEEHQDAWHGSAVETFGIRGRGRMITFIKRDGTRFSASYSHLHGVHLVVGGLRLEFTRYTALVQGERLHLVHHAVSEHRVSYLRESEANDPRLESEAFIQKIIITGLNG